MRTLDIDLTTPDESQPLTGDLTVDSAINWTDLGTATYSGSTIGTVTYTGSTSLAGTVLTVDSGTGPHWTLQAGGGGSLQWASPIPELTLALKALIRTAKATERCRCAPTEVCPECHDLSEALALAASALEKADPNVTRSL